jgi:hypothetical protein
MRSLSSSEYDEAEDVKTKILLSLEPFEEVTEELVLSKLNTLNSIDINHDFINYKNFIKLINNEINRSLTSEEIKYTKAYLYKTVYIPE